MTHRKTERLQRLWAQDNRSAHCGSDEISSALENKMKITAALLSATILFSSVGAVLAGELDPQQNIVDGSAALSNLPLGSEARAEAGNLLDQAQEAYNHHNLYQAYVLASHAQQIENHVE
jgi:hypothetical protein